MLTVALSEIGACPSQWPTALDLDSISLPVDMSEVQKTFKVHLPNTSNFRYIAS